MLAGSGLAWQDGDVHEVRPRDCVIHRANELRAHVHRGDGRARVPRLRHASPDRDRLVAALARDPDRVAVGRGTRRRPLGRRGDGRAARLRRPGAASGEHPQRRTRSSSSAGKIGSTTAPLATAERSELAGLHWEQIAPGARGSPPHCHSEEEEVFVILEGSATLELWPRRRRGDRRGQKVAASGPVTSSRDHRARDVAHAFDAGPDGVTMLIYGTRKPNDLAWFPRSRKVFFRGLGVIGRIETLDYHDGDPTNAPCSSR